MSSHPEMDVFLEAILRDPAEITTRLVFADWLEETGDPSNVAWAQYIRLCDEVHRHPPDSFERSNREWHAENVAVLIEANVSVSVPTLLTHHKLLRELLPLDRFVVELADVEIPREVIGLIPEWTARRVCVLPLDRQELTVLVAIENPQDWDLRHHLRYWLNGDVIAVQAAATDILAALNRHLGPAPPQHGIF